MKNKIVFFGRIKTLQVQCPNCQEWQFEADKCSECGFNFKYEKLEQDRTEYRSEYCGIWCYESYILDNKSLTIDQRRQENLYLKEKKMKQYKPYQLAKELGVKKQTIYRWIREGKIPSSLIRKVKVIKEITIINFPDELKDKIVKHKSLAQLK